MQIKSILFFCILLLCMSGANAQYSRTWAVVIGVGSYQYPTIMSRLNGPANQAWEFKTHLEKSGIVGGEDIPILTNSSATQRNIRKTLEQTFVHNQRIGQNDLIVFYFSGHGLAFGDELGICPYDYFDHAQLLLDQDIISILKRSPAKYKVCIIESCKTETNTASPFPLLSDYQLKELAQARNEIQGGIVYLTSTKAGQPSYEPADLGGGVFSHYFLKGIQGEADYDQNQMITSRELSSYLKSEVSVHTNGIQVPQINQEGYDLNLPLFPVPKNQNPDDIVGRPRINVEKTSDSEKLTIALLGPTFMNYTLNDLDHDISILLGKNTVSTIKSANDSWLYLHDGDTDLNFEEISHRNGETYLYKNGVPNSSMWDNTNNAPIPASVNSIILDTIPDYTCRAFQHFESRDSEYALQFGFRPDLRILRSCIFSNLSPSHVLFENETFLLAPHIKSFLSQTEFLHVEFDSLESLTQGQLAILSQLPKLKSLSISCDSVDLSASAWREFFETTNISSLTIMANDIEGLYVIAQAQSIESLCLAGMSNGEGINIRFLLNLPKLKEVSFPSTYVQNPIYLSRCRNLESIYFPSNITNDAFNQILDIQDQLKMIQFDYGIDNIDDWQILEELTELQALLFYGDVPYELPQLIHNHLSNSRSLVYLSISEDYYEEEEMIYAVAKLEKRGGTFSVNDGFCLGSGWLLLLPLTVLILSGISRFSQRFSNNTSNIF